MKTLHENIQKWMAKALMEDMKVRIIQTHVGGQMKAINFYHCFNPLKTNPEYTQAGVYGKCVL